MFFRIDLTKNRVYSLSEASEKAVSSLSEPLTINVFFTKNLPAPHNNTERYLHDLLAGYANYANRQFNYRFYDVSPDEGDISKEAKENQALARQYGIFPIQIQAIEKDEVKFQKAYMGVVFLYAGKQEILPFIGNTQNLEYDITGVIRRMTEKELKKVGVLSGSDMPGIDKIGKVNQYLTKFYNVTPVDASKNNPIPAAISVLVVFSPRQQQQQMMGMRQMPTPPELPENIKFAVDQYIMNGGKVIFLLSKVTISSQQQFQFAQIVNVGIEDQLESYGIKVFVLKQFD